MGWVASHWSGALRPQDSGIKPGTRASGYIYLLDVLATLSDLAGIKAPPTNEGVSFTPVLMGRKAKTRDVLYGAYSGGPKPGIRSLRKGDWKLIKYDVMNGKVRETQLFNLKDNPHEFLSQHRDGKVAAQTGAAPGAKQVNLAGDPAHGAKLKEMEALLQSEMKRRGDPHRLWDQE